MFEPKIVDPIIVFPSVKKSKLKRAVIDEKQFWLVINGLKWSNATDKMPPNDNIIMYAIFHRLYDCTNVYTRLFMKLAIHTPVGVSPELICGHVIALGFKKYQACINDPSLLTFYSENNECRNFHQIITRYELGPPLVEKIDNMEVFGRVMKWAEIENETFFLTGTKPGIIASRNEPPRTGFNIVLDPRRDKKLAQYQGKLRGD